MSLEEEFRRILKSFENTLPYIPKIGCLPPIMWSDSTFEKYTENSKLSKRPELAEGIAAAKSLLGWYLYNNRISEDTDAMLILFYSMTASDLKTYIFPDDLVNGGKEACKSELLGEETANFVNPLPYSRNMTETSKQESQTNTQYATGYKTLLGATQWHDKLIKFLGEPNDLKNTKNARRVINLIGFLFFNMLRTAVKESSLVAKHIEERAYKAYKSLWGYLEGIEYCYPPHLKMIQEFSMEYRILRPNLLKCLSPLVYAYGHVIPNAKDEVRSILKAGCLLTLSNVGLGILHWAQEASSKSEIPIEKLMEYMAIRRHSNTNLALSELLTKYAADPNSYSWPWARLFTDRAFAKLTVSSNPKYAAVMLSIAVGNDPTSELWNISSVSRHINEEIKSYAITLGTSITENYKKNGSTAETDAARK